LIAVSTNLDPEVIRQLREFAKQGESNGSNPCLDGTYKKQGSAAILFASRQATAAFGYSETLFEILRTAPNDESVMIHSLNIGKVEYPLLFMDGFVWRKGLPGAKREAALHFVRYMEDPNTYRWILMSEDIKEPRVPRYLIPAMGSAFQIEPIKSNRYYKLILAAVQEAQPFPNAKIPDLHDDMSAGILAELARPYMDLNGIIAVLKAVGAAVLISGVASLLVFPLLPLQHWLNSRILLIWNRLNGRPVGITGRWLSIYQTPETGKRTEIVKCNHLSGGEVRGTIDDEKSSDRWKFIGHFIEGEMVAHYWSLKDTKDMGDFKLTFDTNRYTASGPLTLYITLSGKTLPNVNYQWYRYQNIRSEEDKVRAGNSTIEGIGLISNIRFERDEKIGEIRLGPASAQGGKHTLQFKGQHRVVEKPWRFLNHSCVPNARLDRRGIDLLS
jgi:hypothetical protein